MKQKITSTSSSVYFLKNNIVKKVFKNQNIETKFKSEIFCLKKLSKYNIVPKLLKVDKKNNAIYLENVGERISKKNIPKNWKFQLNKILKIFYKEGIQHRDLKLDEVLVKKGQIKIVDFGAAKILNKNKKNQIFDRKKSRYSDDQFIINLIDFYLNNYNNFGELHTIIVWGNKNKTKEIISLLPNSLKIIFSFFYNHSYFGKFGYRRLSFLKKFYSNRDLMHGEKGKQGFFAYIVYDNKPNYEKRKNQFSKEISYVNKNIFDLKNKIRKGRVGFIHASDNLTESFDNIKALTPKWGVYPLNLWKFSQPKFDSFNDFFNKLNKQKKLKYVVLRGFNINKMKLDGADIDILVNDPHIFERETYSEYYKHLKENKSYYGPSVNNGGYKVGANILIGKKKYKFDIRRVGDNYFDYKWQKNMLNNSILRKNVRVLNKIDEFYSLIYHEAIHKGHFRNSTLKSLNKLAKKLNLKQVLKLKDVNSYKYILEKFMKKFSYKYVCPNELSLGCGSKCIKNKKYLKKNKVAHFEDFLNSVKNLNLYIMKDLSIRNIKNNSKFKIFFYLFYFFSRILLNLRHLGMIRFKFIVIYIWLNIKNITK